MGGSIALEVSARGLGRVAGLALIDAHSGGDSPSRLEARSTQIAYAREHGLATLVREKLWPSYVHPSHLSDQDLLELVQAMAVGCGLEQFDRQGELLASRKDRTEVLTALEVPILLVAGADDVLCPEVLQVKMAQSAPAAHREQIEGCGHFAVLESAECVLHLLEGWLARCS